MADYLFTPYYLRIFALLPQEPAAWQRLLLRKKLEIRPKKLFTNCLAYCKLFAEF